MIANDPHTIFVCQGTGCVSLRSSAIQKALEQEVETAGLAGSVQVKLCGCHGFCEQGPLVAIEPEGFLYTHVKAEDAPQIVREHLRDGRPVERLFYRDPLTRSAVPYYHDIPFYKKQMRLIMRNCGHIDPERIDDYIDAGGYEALRKALLEMTRDEVIEEVSRSGLRGRGGAGFPTGRKWAACRRAPGEPKYVICNADEGDPGAYMDRSILEADPHSIIEGMVIGAYAIGASYGFIFVRAEYPLAVDRLRIALRQAEERGFLGDNILNSGFGFSIDIDRGSGAFVSGEATALVASIEGWSGEPRPRPPRTAEAGVWGKPTNINNVKTWAKVPLIIERGAEWFASIGTEHSKGTMVFSLSGKVRNTGPVEVPMGTSLRSLIFDIGGGIPGGKALKAVQTGGPSGGCIPAELADVPVDYERLTELGSIMGSGGLVVMDEDTCMVDVAKYFLSFTMQESCGKCVPCREGIRRMHEILVDITEGRGQEGDIELLEQMGETIIDASLCGLGGSAPNPVLTTIRYFADEYRAHILEKRCPALACKSLVSYYIEPSKCQACQICLRSCPVKAIGGGKDQVHVIDQAACTRCGTCFEVCPPRFGAVTRLSGMPVPVAPPLEERLVARAR
ncbi:MAG: NADH-quinone oxidoreductase subunit NuoF [Chloroflexi bacterium]|nr:NADH-quinone oxidoreductase subunit NuoF [Chloroflexota bacterium]MCL5027066.1 NADH-quinone oxidoreductase subunit NuoF [Chloroflexota bacterium]